MKRSLFHKRRGFLLAELLFSLALFSVVLAISVQALAQAPFKERVRDVAFMNRLKGAIVNQRVRSVREPGVGYNFLLPGDGTVLFNRQGSTYLVLKEPDYRVYIQPGVSWRVLVMPDFKNWTTNLGTNGFTLSIYKKDRLLAKLVFQVATSSFREEIYGN